MRERLKGGGIIGNEKEVKKADQKATGSLLEIKMGSEKEIRRKEEGDIGRGKSREKTQSGKKGGVMERTNDLGEAEGGSEKGRASVQAMIEEGPENSRLDGRMTVEPYNQIRVIAKSPLQVLDHDVISGRAAKQNKVLVKGLGKY